MGFRIFVVILIVAAVTYGIVYFIHSLLMKALMMHMCGDCCSIATEVKGKVTNVYIDDNQYVEVGKPLLEIYQQDYFDLAKEKKMLYPD